MLDHSVHGRAAYLENRRSFIERALAALFALAFSVDMDGMGVPEAGNVCSRPR